ncbi:unnamed protein product [Closterium sp. Yama58-4]|nr:unnamed protein product [Closterium sp. Yama58-4]
MVPTRPRMTALPVLFPMCNCGSRGGCRRCIGRTFLVSWKPGGIHVAAPSADSFSVDGNMATEVRSPSEHYVVTPSSCTTKIV